MRIMYSGENTIFNRKIIVTTLHHITQPRAHPYYSRDPGARVVGNKNNKKSSLKFLNHQVENYDFYLSFLQFQFFHIIQFFLNEPETGVSGENHRCR